MFLPLLNWDQVNLQLSVWQCLCLMYNWNFQLIVPWIQDLWPQPGWLTQPRQHYTLTPRIANGNATKGSRTDRSIQPTSPGNSFTRIRAEEQKSFLEEEEAHFCPWLRPMKLPGNDSSSDFLIGYNSVNFVQSLQPCSNFWLTTFNRKNSTINH